MCTVHFAYSTTFIYILYTGVYVLNLFSIQPRHYTPTVQQILHYSLFCTILFSCVFFLSGRQPDCLTGYYSGKFVYISDRGRMCVCVRVCTNGAFNCTRNISLSIRIGDAACDQPLVTLSLHTTSTFKMDSNFSRLFLCSLIQLIAFSRFALFFKSMRKRLCTVVYLNAFINSKLIFISVPGANARSLHFFFNSLHMG